MWSIAAKSRICHALLLLSALPGCTAAFEEPSGGPGDFSRSGRPISSSPSNSGPEGTGVVPTQQLDPGRVVLRRLNRTEYDNTVRDLLGTQSTPAHDTFAADDVEDGFDTIGESLVVSLLLTEQMDKAATSLIDELLARPVGDPQRGRILTCEPSSTNAGSCLPQILGSFMRSAYRRPVTAEEIQSRVALATNVQLAGGDALRGLGAALKSIILSPHFLYRVELGDPSSPDATPVSDYELASRLSYFLWASMPDPPLLELAEAKKLTSSRDDLAREVERLLSDQKSKGFVESFVGQWLSARDALQFVADPVKFPTYDDALREAMPHETESFFKSLLDEKQPLSALLLAKYSFVDSRLAKQYGLPAGQSDFVRTSLEGTPRIGILTQETFLTVSSYPARTSPVRRANWILENLLCDPPPAAPPKVPALKETLPPGATLRQTFEAHRADPGCAACHKIMDPIGFALENFDAMGSYRTVDNGAPVDASGQLADGTPLNGAEDLARAIAKDPKFGTCVAKQLLTYAVGRSFGSKEAKAYAAGIAVAVKDATWPDFIQAIVQSEAFRTRRGEVP